MELVLAVYDGDLARRDRRAWPASASCLHEIAMGAGPSTMFPEGDAQRGATTSAVLIRFDGSTIVSGKSFASKADALEAVGLREP